MLSLGRDDTFVAVGEWVSRVRTWMCTLPIQQQQQLFGDETPAINYLIVEHSSRTTKDEEEKEEGDSIFHLWAKHYCESTKN